jgi:hypothetical protein
MFRLESAQGMAQQHPDTFEVASIERLQECVKPGVYAKVCVLDGAFQGERIWTQVTEVDEFKVKATLANEPFGFNAEHGDPIEYQLHNIYNVTAEDGEELA